MTDYHIRRDALGFYYHTPVEEPDEAGTETNKTAAPPPAEPLTKKRGRPKYDPDSR